jgi:hypothetical protein
MFDPVADQGFALVRRIRVPIVCPAVHNNVAYAHVRAVLAIAPTPKVVHTSVNVARGSAQCHIVFQCWELDWNCGADPLVCAGPPGPAGRQRIQPYPNQAGRRGRRLRSGGPVPLDANCAISGKLYDIAPESVRHNAHAPLAVRECCETWPAPAILINISSSTS